MTPRLTVRLLRITFGGPGRDHRPPSDTLRLVFVLTASPSPFAVGSSRSLKKKSSLHCRNRCVIRGLRQPFLWRRLCDNSIIRDEHITSLSLDLKETGAIRPCYGTASLGASDADVWIARGATLVSLAKRRTGTAQQDVTAANSEVAAAAKRLDEVRASALTDTTVAESVERLRAFASTTVAPDELAGPVRERMAAVTTEIESLRLLSANWATAETERSRIVDLTRAVDGATAERDAAAAVLQGLPGTVLY